MVKIDTSGTIQTQKKPKNISLGELLSTLPSSEELRSQLNTQLEANEASQISTAVVSAIKNCASTIEWNRRHVDYTGPSFVRLGDGRLGDLLKADSESALQETLDILRKDNRSDWSNADLVESTAFSKIFTERLEYTMRFRTCGDGMFNLYGEKCLKDHLVEEVVDYLVKGLYGDKYGKINYSGPGVIKDAIKSNHSKFEKQNDGRARSCWGDK